MLELASVSKYYGRKGARPAALHDVTLSVPTGSVWAVVGPNGAGKSTLLSLLLGFIRPSSGSIEVAGEAPSDYRRDHGVGYLPERFGLPSSWRVRDALRLFAGLEGAAAMPVDRGADETDSVHRPDATGAMERFGLTAHADHRVDELSRGLMQRLGLAQALLVPHPLVVLDEPTEGLDPVWRIRLRDEVAAMRAAGRTVIIASHDLGEIERMADRAVLLKDGAVREIIDVRGDVGTSTFDVVLDRAFDRMSDAFPDAAARGELTYRVHVADAAELSERLGAMIAMGGVVKAVHPAGEALEDRVRTALDDSPPEDPS